MTKRMDMTKLLETLNDRFISGIPASELARWECATCGADVKEFAPGQVLCSVKPAEHRARRLKRREV